MRSGQKHNYFIFSFLLIMGMASCATTPQEPFETIVYSPSHQDPVESVGYELSQGQSKYLFKNRPYAAAWIMCRPTKTIAKALVVMFHEEAESYDQTFCSRPESQAFLGAQYTLLGVLRPGYGASSGDVDYFGDQSSHAVRAALDEARGISRLPVTGAYGFASGAAAAAAWSKTQRDIAWMILGDGIYDFESLQKTLSPAEKLQTVISKMTAKTGERGMEERSVAFDVSGLPKTIFLYHFKKDPLVPFEQSVRLKETLVSQEYRIRLQIVQDEGEAFPPKDEEHRTIVKTLVDAL